MSEDAFKYLDDLYKASGLTHQQISDLSGVAVGTVSRILSGTTKDPSFYNVSSIIIAMGGSMDELSGKTVQCVRTQEEKHDRCECCKSITISREAFTHAYDEIKKQHEIELDRVKQYLRNKDRWLIAMFGYCVVLTLIVIFKSK